MLRSSGWAWFWSVVRILAAVAGVAAVVAQLVLSVSNALSATLPYRASVSTTVWNFLSFFTIQSNVLAIVTMTIGAVWFWTRGRKDAAALEPRWYAILLVCTTTYMVITGIVYNLLLRNVDLLPGTIVPWSNEILHVAVPIVLFLDLFLAPRRRALPWRSVGIVVIYPIVWVVYTLIRGPFITSPATGDPWWYPYPFLNPNNAALVPPGWAGVAVYIVGIAIGIIAVGLLVVWVGRVRGASGGHAPTKWTGAAVPR